MYVADSLFLWVSWNKKKSICFFFVQMSSFRSSLRLLTPLRQSAATQRNSVVIGSSAVIRSHASASSTATKAESPLHQSLRALHTTHLYLQGGHHRGAAQAPSVGTTHSGPGPRLSVVRPDLAAEWAVELNEDIDVSHVECGFHRAVWWRCSSCGNAFTSTVVERVESDKGCPDCAGNFTGLHEGSPDTANVSGSSPAAVAAQPTTPQGNSVGSSSLAATHPHLVVLWHPTRNGTVRAQDVTSSSHALVWWAVTSGAGIEEFQQSVAQFVLDPRSPMQKEEDRALVETAVISHVAEAARAPHVPLVEPQYVYTEDDTLTTLAHLHMVSRKHPRGDPVVSPIANADRVIFQRQPRRSTEEALRTKALSFFVNKVVDGKLRDAPGSSQLTEASIRSALGDDMPSYAFIPGTESTEAVDWKRYFSLAPHEAELAWTLKRGPSIAVESSASAAQETTEKVDDATSLQQSASPSSAPRTLEAYPAKPSFTIPAEHPDDRTLSPRKIQRKRVTPPTQHTSHHRDEDGGRESFGKYDDRFLDENDAMTMYDAPQTTLDGSNDATSELSLQDQQYQRQQQGRRPQRRPRRTFEMKMPSELVDAGSEATAVESATPAPTPAVLPNAPRVVARSKRRSSPSSEEGHAAEQ
jgi:predicted  nucleic acid-binding Zn-ribbon protein